MKTSNMVWQSLILFTIIFLVACKKDKAIVNVRLYDKSADIQKTYVKGNWKLQYETGGICGYCVNDFRMLSFLWNIQPNDSIKQFYNGELITDTLIVWSKEKPVITADSAYIMSFLDKRRLLYSLLPYAIKNDTLIMKDIGYDPVTYYFARY